jgi:hypothetical protein
MTVWTKNLDVVEVVPHLRIRKVPSTQIRAEASKRHISKWFDVVELQDVRVRIKATLTTFPANLA